MTRTIDTLATIRRSPSRKLFSEHFQGFISGNVVYQPPNRLQLLGSRVVERFKPPTQETLQRRAELQEAVSLMADQPLHIRYPGFYDAPCIGLDGTLSKPDVSKPLTLWGGDPKSAPSAFELSCLSPDDFDNYRKAIGLVYKDPATMTANPVTERSPELPV